MPAIVLLAMVSQGHDCYPPTPATESSTNVFANNIGIVRVGDAFATHCCNVKPFPCHPVFQGTGSPNVFVNNRAVARIGDTLTCGDHDGQGSPNVYAN